MTRVFLRKKIFERFQACLGGKNEKSVRMFLLICLIGLLAFAFSACEEGQGESKGGHKHEYMQSIVEPTCTDKGYTKYLCACGDCYMEEYADALGHAMQNMEAQKATCTEDGVVEHWYCSRCNSNYSDEKGITKLNGIVAPKLGHKMQRIEGKPPPVSRRGLSITGIAIVAFQITTIGREKLG